MNEARTLIVNYHYCVGEDENPYLARTAVSPERFAPQIESLAGLKDRVGIEPLVTFDDGTRDIWRNAIPVLLRHRVPSILFCCSLPLLTRRLLNVTKIHLLQAKIGLPNFRTRFMSVLNELKKPYLLEDLGRLNLGRIFRYDVEEVRDFKLLLNVKLPYPIVTELLDMLFEQEFGSQEEAVKAIYMSADEIKKAHDAGVGIGLHTHSHFMLGRLSAAEQEAEITTNLALFRDLLGGDTFELSYPHGVQGTWNDDTKMVMSRLEILRAYTLGRQIYSPQIHHDEFEIPRYDVNDVFESDGALKSEFLK